MDKERYIINDPIQFTESIRKAVFSGFGEEAIDDPDEFTKLINDISPEQEQEMNEVLTLSESLVIVKELAKKEKNKKTQEIRYIINEKIFSNIVESINARLVSNILSDLIKKGLVETGYDSEINDFVFWVKNTDRENS
jgi:hypothetical protein